MEYLTVPTFKDKLLEKLTRENTLAYFATREKGAITLTPERIDPTYHFNEVSDEWTEDDNSVEEVRCLKGAMTFGITTLRREALDILGWHTSW